MQIFTDGSYTTKPDIGGMGAVILSKHKEFRVGLYDHRCSDNNVAEVAAIAMALQYIRDKRLADRTDDKTIQIFSDSAYALRKIAQRGRGRTDFEDACLSSIFDFLDVTSKKVSFFQIKGHVHDGTKLSHYNNEADMLAREHRLIGLDKYRTMIAKTGRNKKGRNEY